MPDLDARHVGNGVQTRGRAFKRHAEIAGARLIHTDPSLISPIVFNVNDSFSEAQPEVTQLVIDTYERARAWVLENPDEALEIYAAEAGLEGDVAEAKLFALSEYLADVWSAALLLAQSGAEKRLDAVTKSHTDKIDDLLKHKEAELLEV